MPNWKTHLEISKRLNKYLKYDKENLELFTLGNILPDINNGYLVKNVSKKIPHEKTHFQNEIQPTYPFFYDCYQEEMKNKNPLFLGYYAHLYTDYNWNGYFYKKEVIKNSKEEHETLTAMKHNDFKIFNNTFLENKIAINYIENDLEKIEQIKEVSVSKNDLLEAENFLKNQKPYEGTLKVIKIDEFEELMDNTVKGILSQLTD